MTLVQKQLQRQRYLPTQESEHLRLLAFQIYSHLLVKVKRSVLVFPLKHQIFNMIVCLVLHLQDVNSDVAQVRGPAWGLALSPIPMLSMVSMWTGL